VVCGPTTGAPLKVLAKRPELHQLVRDAYLPALHEATMPAEAEGLYARWLKISIAPTPSL